MTVTTDKSPKNIIPFHTFILKIQSRCNLNCTYCFVYNQADQSWKNKPGLISEKTVRQTAARIIEHNKAHNKDYVSVIFHGGEPLLGGAEHLEMILDILQSSFDNEKIDCRFGMQSNGLLFTEEIGDLMKQKKLRMGVSIDGPPELNDNFRVDHMGRGTGKKLESKLKLLTSKKYKDRFSGFLCVMNLDHDPIQIYEYLKHFDPPSIDFLMPYDNWSRLPYKYNESEALTLYADWFIRLFDHWVNDPEPVPIRTFDSIIRLIFGGKSLIESMGLEAVDLVVVETDGAIEAVDSLKAAADGATDLSLNVFDNSFDEAARHADVIARQLGASKLSDKCQSCDIVSICGGGYIPTRYSNENGFRNPSVYCRDHDKIIRHIYQTSKQYMKN